MYLPEEKARELQRRHSKDVLAPAIAAAQAAGVKFVSEILIGDIPAALALCRGEGLRRHRHGHAWHEAIGNLVMGSVATKVIHLTKLPVTLVK